MSLASLPLPGAPPPSAPSPRGAARPGRAYFLDVLKLVVSLQMINGHVLNELLRPELRAGLWFDRYTHFRGLVSVSFLVVAGMAFYLGTLVQLDRHLADRRAVRRRFGRALALIAIGYALRFSPGIWSSKPDVAQRSWETFLRCDALQCIGLTLLFLQTVTVLARRQAAVVGLASALAAAIFLAAPFVDTAVPTDGPRVHLYAYLTHQTGSLFPLLPWSGYMLAGVGLAALALPRGVAAATHAPWPRLVLCGAVLFALSELLARAGWLAVPPAAHPATSPGHALGKLAELALILGGLAWLCRPLRRFPPVLAQLARDTLSLYVVHLILLYRWPRFTRVFGRESLSLGAALAASLLLVALTAALVLARRHGWPRLRARWQARARAATLSPPSAR